MAMPENSLIMWTGLRINIPGDWSEETNYRDRFVEGHNEATHGSSEAGVNGGSLTHTHTANSHSHDDKHSHSLTISGAASGGTTNVNFTGLALNYTALDGHTHGTSTTGLSDQSLNGTTLTISAASAVPPYTTAIFLEPDDNMQNCPAGAIVWHDLLDPVPDGWEIADGNNGTTIDLGGTYIRGAASGADGGSTGGAATHTHTTVAHTHTQSAHNHGNLNPFADGSPTNSFTQFSFGAQPVGVQHHFANLLTSSSITWGNSTPGMSSVTNHPQWITLAPIQNVSGGDKPPFPGMTLMFTGDSESLPNDWYLMDGSHGTYATADSWALAETNGTAGGASGAGEPTVQEHSHVGDSHTHASSGFHTHAYIFNTTTVLGDSGVDTTSGKTHAHTSNTISSESPSSESSGFTMATQDGRQPFRTVHFIRYLKPRNHQILGSTTILGSIHIGTD